MLRSAKIFSIFFIFIFLLFSFPVLAAEEIKPDLQIKIGENYVQLEAITCPLIGDCEIDWISNYVAAIYQYGVGLAAVLATVMIMVGGFLWLTAGGSPQRVGKAKEFIISSFTGLLLALFSFMILQTINPQLVTLRGLSIPTPSSPSLSRLSGSQCNEPISINTTEGRDYVEGVCKEFCEQDCGSSVQSLERVPNYAIWECTCVPIFELPESGRPNQALEDAMVCLSRSGSAALSGLRITSITEGTHNPGSCHGVGLAADYAWDGMGDITQFCNDATNCGFTNCFDERTNTTGSSAWSGSHMHLAACNCRSGGQEPIYDQDCANTITIPF